jgi:hypothetical protein
MSHPKHEYILRSPEPGIRGRTIMRVTTDPDGRENGSAVLWLPAGTPGETMVAVLDALRRAHEDGREERSAELIPHREEAADFLRDLVRSSALGAISQWATGWTDSVTGPDGIMRQYRIDCSAEDEANHALVLDAGEQRYEPTGRYRVQVLVEEVRQS